jgi:hypothetical protein
MTRDRRVTVLVQGLAPALSDGSRLLWAAPSSLHEELGYRALAPDRIQGDAARPRFDKAQSGIMSARSGPVSLRPERVSLAPRSPPSSPLRVASGGDLRSGLTAAARRVPTPVLGTKKRSSLEQRNSGALPSHPLDTKPHTRTRGWFAVIPKFIALTRQDITAICTHNRSSRAMPVGLFARFEAPMAPAMRGRGSRPHLRVPNTF